MRTIIIVAVYWVIVVAAVYAIRAYNQKKNRSLKAALKGIGEKDSIWKQIGTHASIILLMPPLMPVIIPCYIISRIVKQIKSKKMKMNKETQNEKKPKSIIDQNMPEDLQLVASSKLLDALTSGEFGEFENLLDNDVCSILYGNNAIKGKSKVVEYWKGWRERHIATGNVTNLKVTLSRYYSHACLQIQETMLVLFQVKDEKIVRTVLLPTRLTSLYSDDHMLNYPYDYDRIKQYLTTLSDSVDAKGEPIMLENRIPCMSCGVESQDLTWYNIRIPDWFYKNWKLGLVSVCPKCGRIVEYKEIKTIESEVEENVPLEGSKCSDRGNFYSEYAKKMYSKEKIGFLENALDGEIVPELSTVVTKSFAETLIPEPSEIKLEDGHKFELTLPTQEGSGDITHIRIVDRVGNETEDLTEHLIINTTEMGVWQLYLLENYYTVLPTFWHGGYNQCEYIFKESDIDNIIPLKYHDLTELKELDKLLPCVTVSEDADNSYTAIVNCCYWNKWEGLVRETVEYKIESCRVGSEARSKEVLFHFHCGIWF